jgi:hypothetical protein
VVHWHDAHLSAPAEAFRDYLLEFAAELRGSDSRSAKSEAAPAQHRKRRMAP